jgi:hypothetical protein
MLDTLSRSVRWLRRVEAAGERALYDANIKEILTISRRSLVTHEHFEEWATLSLGEGVASAVAARNQIHHGGFLFVKYLGLPAIKRDVFFRELYPLEEIDERLEFLPKETKEEVMADLRQKGTARLLPGLSRILYRHGSI